MSLLIDLNWIKRIVKICAHATDSPIALNEAYYEAYWYECALRNYEKHQLRHIHTGPIASVFIIFMCTIRNKSQMALHTAAWLTRACKMNGKYLYEPNIIPMLRKTKSDQIKKMYI